MSPTDPSLNPAVVLALVFAGVLVLSLMVRFWLASRQMRHVARHSHAVPEAFAGTVPLESHRKAARYALTNGSFGLWSMTFSGAVLVGWTLLGGLGWLNESLLDTIRPRFGDMAYQLVLLSAFMLIGSLLELPFDLYSTFRIEQAFGFNRMTWKLYLADAAKGLLLGALIGLPLAAGMLWIMGSTGALWWLWAWAAWAHGLLNAWLAVLRPKRPVPLPKLFE
jgi:STE24 endopeptidase